MSDFITQEITRIRKLVGDKAQVIGAVSGGVDSTVAARLMKEAIGMTLMAVLYVYDEANTDLGDRFHAILVDNGLTKTPAQAWPTLTCDRIDASQ